LSRKELLALRQVVQVFFQKNFIVAS